MGKIEIQVVQIQQEQQLAGLARQTFRQAYADEMHPQQMDQHIEQELSDGAFRTMLSTDQVLVATGEGVWVGFVQVGIAPPNLEVAFTQQDMAS